MDSVPLRRRGDHFEHNLEYNRDQNDEPERPQPTH
jgi:hypothetical protein